MARAAGNDLPSRGDAARSRDIGLPTLRLRGDAAGRPQSRIAAHLSKAHTVSLKKLGRYDIVKPLGKGAMGLVYEAHDPNIDRHVAIKTIRVDQLSEEMAAEYESRFRAEARAGGRLQHPNIIGVYDAGRDQNVAFMVMELVRGGDLKQQLEHGAQLGLPRTFAVMRGLLAALGFAHEQGIIHRDIKPANVMLDSNGRVKLGDFGVARITHSGEATSTQGSMVGTLKYMSPEQVQGLPVDARTDLFAAGVVLYQMLTGAKPFDGPNDFAIMQAIAQQEPLPPSQVDRAMPAALDAVIAKALAKNRDARYASAREFLLALRMAVTPVGQEVAGLPAGKVAAGGSLGVGVAVSRPVAGPAVADASAGQSSAAGSSSASPPTASGSRPASTTATGTGGARPFALGPPPTSPVTSAPSTLPPVHADPSGIMASPLVQEMELFYWKDIKDSSDPVDFQGFLQQFPAGLYASLAARRLRRLARSLADGTGSQSVAGSSPFGSSLPGVAAIDDGRIGQALPGADGGFAEAAPGDATAEARRLAAARAAEEEALWQQEQARRRQRPGGAPADAAPVGHRAEADARAGASGGPRAFADSAFAAVPSPSSFIDLSTAPMPLSTRDEAPGQMSMDTVPVELSASALASVRPGGAAPHLAAATVESPAPRAGKAPSTPPEWPPRSERKKSRRVGAAVAVAVALLTVAAWWAGGSHSPTGAAPTGLAASPPVAADSLPGATGAASGALPFLGGTNR